MDHEWIFWTLVVIMLIWIILKATGIIQTLSYLDIIGPSGLLWLSISIVMLKHQLGDREMKERFEKVNKKFE